MFRFCNVIRTEMSLLSHLTLLSFLVLTLPILPLLGAGVTLCIKIGKCKLKRCCLPKAGAKKTISIPNVIEVWQFVTLFVSISRRTYDTILRKTTICIQDGCDLLCVSTIDLRLEEEFLHEPFCWIYTSYGGAETAK